MRILGRLLVRKDKVSGIYIPFVPNGLESGVHNIIECLGEIQIQYVGKQAMKDATYQGLDLQGLFTRITEAAITLDEIKNINGPI